MNEVLNALLRELGLPWDRKKLIQALSPYTLGEPVRDVNVRIVDTVGVVYGPSGVQETLWGVRKMAMEDESAPLFHRRNPVPVGFAVASEPAAAHSAES